MVQFCSNMIVKVICLIQINACAPGAAPIQVWPSFNVLESSEKIRTTSIFARGRNMSQQSSAVQHVWGRKLGAQRK